MENKYLDPTKFHFLDSRGAVIEGILELHPKRFTKKELHETLYEKLSVSSVTNNLSELKFANYIIGYKEGRSYYYEIADIEKIQPLRGMTEKLPQRKHYIGACGTSLCLWCEGTTIDIAASENRGRPLVCQECNGDGINDWLSKITREEIDWI